MNTKRIVELMKQSGLQPYYDSQQGDIEKFSELIVKECMEQVWYTREDMINDNISEVIKLRIKEHFGVEE